MSSSAARVVLSALALAIVVSSGCRKRGDDAADDEASKPKRSRRTAVDRAPRLLLARDTKAGDPKAGTLVLAAPEGDSAPVDAFAADTPSLRDLVPFDGGRGAIATVGGADAKSCELRVVRVGERLELGATLLGEAPCAIENVSRSGRFALLAQTLPGDRERLVLARLLPTAKLVELGTIRGVRGADFSPEEARALYAATTEACTEKYVGKCPVDLFGLDLAAQDPKPFPIATSPDRASYMPRFVPRDPGVILFQTTTLDTSDACAKDGLDACEHDLVTLDWKAKGRPKLLRKNAIGAQFTETGSRFVFEEIDADAKCTQLPCTTATLSIMDAGGGGYARIVAGDAAWIPRRAVSPDERFVAYRHYEGGKVLAKVRTLEGRESRVFDAMAPRGWIR